MTLKTLGYQVLIHLNEKDMEVVDENGIIIAARTNHHKLRSGVVFEMGSMARREDTELEIGDTVHFFDNDLVRYRINDMEFGILRTDNIKVIEKKEQ